MTFFKNLSLASKIQILLTILLTLTSTSLLVWALVFQKDDEPGLMSVCWDSSGTAVFNPTMCKEIEFLTWDRGDIPLSVNADDDAEINAAVADAISAVNNQFGCRLLRQTTSYSENFDIAINANVPMSVGLEEPGGSTSFRRSLSGKFRAFISVYASSLSPELLGKILVHELGHALGLAHDPDLPTTSIMRPMQEPGLEVIGFTRNDKKLIRSLYCAN